MHSYLRQLQIVALASAHNLRDMEAMSASGHGSDGEEDYEASQHLMDDSLYSDVSRLEIDLSLPIEGDIDRNIRLYQVLNESTSGNELYENILNQCPTSGVSIGKVLVMNRASKHFISERLMAKDSYMAYGKATKTYRDLIKLNFSSTVKETSGWRNLIKALFQGVIMKKPLLKRLAVSAILNSTNVPISTAVPTSVRIIDRTALLACGLVDPSLLDQWVEIASPITAANRPAILDMKASAVINARWRVLAEDIMSKRGSYSNPF